MTLADDILSQECPEPTSDTSAEYARGFRFAWDVRGRLDAELVRGREAEPMPADEPIVVGGRTCNYFETPDSISQWFIIATAHPWSVLHGDGTWKTEFPDRGFPTRKAAVAFAKSLSEAERRKMNS